MLKKSFNKHNIKYLELLIIGMPCDVFFYFTKMKFDRSMSHVFLDQLVFGEKATLNKNISKRKMSVVFLKRCSSKILQF